MASTTCGVRCEGSGWVSSLLLKRRWVTAILGPLRFGRDVACQESIDDDDPHEHVVGSPQPPIFHFGVGLLSNQQAVDQVGFTGAQIALTRAPVITIGADADTVVTNEVSPTAWCWFRSRSSVAVSVPTIERERLLV